MFGLNLPSAINVIILFALSMIRGRSGNLFKTSEVSLMVSLTFLIGSLVSFNQSSIIGLDISENMVKSKNPGSIIYDLAVTQGGNSAFSQADKVNVVNGVKIMGAKNILNKLALTASNLYAKNLSSFVNNLYNKEKKDVYINQEDEIISKTLINKEL